MQPLKKSTLHLSEKCFVWLNERYNHKLEKHFDVKCYDFKNQFSGYLEYLSERLEDRRYETQEYVRRETNDPRDKESECIWKRPDLMEKTRNWLIDMSIIIDFATSVWGLTTKLVITRKPMLLSRKESPVYQPKHSAAGVCLF